MLFNETKKIKIIKKIKIADSFFRKFKGLVFEKKENFDYGLIFHLEREGRINASIHMLFVFFPIDAVFLNSKKKVVDIARNLRPFILNYTPKKAAKYIVELPIGLSEKIELDDKLKWD